MSPPRPDHTTRKPRIVHFTSSLVDPLGGAEKYAVMLAKWQRESGLDVELACSWLSPRAEVYIKGLGLRVTCLPSARPHDPATKSSGARKAVFHLLDFVGGWWCPRGILQGLRSYDVIHVHRFQGVGSSMLRIRGRVVVHTVHDFVLVDPNATNERNSPGVLTRLVLGAWRVSSRRNAAAANVLISPTRRTLDLHRQAGFDSPSIHWQVIPHGWAPDTTSGQQEPTAARSSSSPRPVRLLFLGKVSAEKGIEVLLDAWAGGVPGAELVIAGAGPLERRVAAQAAAQDNVRWLGWLDDTARQRALREADALVVPSLWPENFPIVVAEALLMGVPVLATMTSSPPLVEEGVSGLVALDDSSLGLRDVIRKFAADSALRTRLADGALAASGELDIAAHLTRVMAAYETSALGTRRPT